MNKKTSLKKRNEVVAPSKMTKAATLATPTDLKAKATTDVSDGLNVMLADVFALYLKTRNFHWHVSGPHFRDYHLMLDEQSEQIYAMVDPMAERIRKLGGMTIRSISHISQLQRITDNNADFVGPTEMLAELCEDNKLFAENLREVHEVCGDHKDFPSASLIEEWIDQAERRTWFLFEATRTI